MITQEQLKKVFGKFATLNFPDWEIV